jgi:serine/threonine protein phosphatase PrpC
VLRDLGGGTYAMYAHLTAMLRSGSQLALVHIGDTRAYLLCGSGLFRLTQDHTYVQSLVDQGKLGRDEAASHPQRALLVRALGAGGHQVEVDLALRTARASDRYLLCAVVDRAALHAALSVATDPEQVVQRLIEHAYAQAAPDNVACVIADIVAV